MALNRQGPDGANVDCQRVEKEEMIERYLTGKLSELEGEAFEQHYLGCQRCFDELQFRHAAAIELKRQPKVSFQPAAALGNTRWAWGLATAAVLLVTLFSVTTFYRRQNPGLVQEPPVPIDTRHEMIDQLALVDPVPPYVPVTMRGGKPQAATERFQDGMQRYTQHNYAAAITLLQEAIRLDANLQPALFYLGISQLMMDQPDEAIGQFSRLTHMETSPYLEDSHWYLAKAFLKKRELAAAQQELEAVVTLNGSHLEEARQALQVIRRLAKESLK